MSSGPREDLPLFDLLCFVAVALAAAFLVAWASTPDVGVWVVPAGTACCLLAPLPRLLLARK